MSVRRQVRVTHDGRRQVSRQWYCFGRTHLGLRYALAAGPDKAAAQEMDAAITRLVEARRTGREVHRLAADWLSRQPPAMLERLASMALVGERECSEATGIDHLIDAWGEDLIASGRVTERYRKLKTARAKTAAGMIKARLWSDLRRPGNAARIVRAIGQAAKARGWSARSQNHHLDAIKAFARWQARQLSEVSPFDHVMASPTKITASLVTRRRRALQHAEVELLLRRVLEMPARFGLTGLQRNRLYRVVLWTGLRAEEARTLEAGNVSIDHKLITIPAARTKNGETAEIPIVDAGLLAELEESVRGRASGDRLFPFSARQAAAMLKADLADAQIPYETAAGFADFHAMRTTLATNLYRAGVPLAQASKVMRHADVRTTMRHYSDLQLTDQRGALEQLAEYTAKAQRVQRTG